jgi:outer membrane protein TolC
MKLALNQPIFTSGKLHNALQLRREEQGAVVLQTRQLHAEVQLAVEQAFNELLLAEEGLALNEEVAALTGTVRGEAESRFAAHAASRMELLEAESVHTRSQLPVLRARQDVGSRRDGLAYVIGWPPEQPLAIAGTLAFAPVTLDVDDLLARARATRPDVQLAEQQIVVRERELRAVLLTGAPSVSLVGAYEFVQRERNDLPQNVLSGGMALTWPILDGGTILPRVQAARLAVQEAGLRRDRVRRQADLELRKAAAAVTVAGDACRTQQRAVDTARERVRVVEAGVRFGTAAPVDLARARLELLDARLAEAQLRFDHAMAKARLTHLVGAPPGEL